MGYRNLCAVAATGWLVACSGSVSGHPSTGGHLPSGGSAQVAGGSPSTGGQATTGGKAIAAGAMNSGGTGAFGTGGLGSGGPEAPPPAVCAPPVALIDTATADQVVGDGTPASCSQQALQEAVNAGGKVTFDCGDLTTIAINRAIQLPLDQDVTVDGGGHIILDGGRNSGHHTRIFEFNSPDYRATDTTFTLQRITLQNAQAPASDFTAQDSANPRCAWGYRDGQGGAVLIRDGILHVIDSTFINNAAATPGPDTGGGAIYAMGSKEVVVTGSVFESNSGSNAGAIGLLQSDGIFANSTFINNIASGSGANYGGAGECGVFNHDQQGGAGGNAGAVGIDGNSVARVSFCGVHFEGNQAGALGTVFRTPNARRESTTFDRCSFINNFSEEGGAGIYTQDMDLTIVDSTFSGNRANGGGGAIRLEQGAHGSVLTMTNTTLHDNAVTRALGGALSYDGPGTLQNCTFAGNRAIGGYDASAMAAFFAAAISGGTMTVHNTIFLDNTDTHPWTPMTCRVGTPMPGSNNMQWPRKRLDEDGNASTQDDTPCSVETIWRDAALEPLTDNGGPTPTLMPAANSPAIGIGQDCPPYDQRGQPRPVTGCAAGAIEPN